MLESRQKKKKIKLPKSPKAKYRTFISVFILLLVVFMTSTFWVPDTSNIKNTAYGTQAASSDDVKLKLEKWMYNPDKNYMETTFYVDEGQFAFSNNLVFSPSVYNGSTSNSVPCSVAFSNDDTLIIRIKNLPKKWKVLMMQITDNSEDLLTKEVDDTTSSAADAAGNIGKAISGQVTANFYCDYRAVEQNTALAPKSEKDYAIDSTLYRISTTQKQISDDKNAIAQNKNTIFSLQKDIKAIQTEQSYQTTSEISDSTEVMQNKQNSIAELGTKNDELNQEIGEYQDKISKLNLKLSDIRSGTTRVYSDKVPDADPIFADSTSNGSTSSSAAASTAGSAAASSKPTVSTSSVPMK